MINGFFVLFQIRIVFSAAFQQQVHRMKSVVAVSSVMLMHTFQTQQSVSSNNKHIINQFKTFCAYNNVNILCMQESVATF